MELKKTISTCLSNDVVTRLGTRAALVYNIGFSQGLHDVIIPSIVDGTQLNESQIRNAQTAAVEALHLDYTPKVVNPSEVSSTYMTQKELDEWLPQQAEILRQEAAKRQREQEEERAANSKRQKIAQLQELKGTMEAKKAEYNAAKDAAQAIIDEDGEMAESLPEIQDLQLQLTDHTIKPTLTFYPGPVCIQHSPIFKHMIWIEANLIMWIRQYRKVFQVQIALKANGTTHTLADVWKWLEESYDTSDLAVSPSKIWPSSRMITIFLDDAEVAMSLVAMAISSTMASDIDVSTAQWIENINPIPESYQLEGNGWGEVTMPAAAAENNLQQEIDRLKGVEADLLARNKELAESVHQLEGNDHLP